MNDQTFIQDTGTDSVMYYAFDTTDEANAAMESFLADYTENVNPQFDYESKATYAAEFEGMRSMFLLLGGALSVIVGLVGVLNFFNAILTGIITRKREMAVLQSIGMTGKQLKTMLVCEGLLYALSSVLACPWSWRWSWAPWPSPPCRACSGSSPTASPWPPSWRWLRCSPCWAPWSPWRCTAPSPNTPWWSACGSRTTDQTIQRDSSSACAEELSRCISLHRAHRMGR